MSALDPTRFRAAMDLVDRALDAPSSDRDALIEAERDADVRAEARRLLAADARAGDFLSEPAAAGVPSAIAELAHAQSSATAGDVIGPFRLVSLVGRGGMGEVWVGERTGADFEQRVAIKLLPIASDASAAARFRRERRILGKLSHPRIAKLLDGGVTPSGRPWLAMELVLGKSLTEHCKEKQLDVDERLRLFAEVCDAVQYAHRNLVVHRDLKPSNILVEPSGEPKLLDFGIAKLLEESNDDDALTRTEERPMTLEYASPEQVRGGAITTTTDVWALGVILYELLTGARPYSGGSRVSIEQAILAATPTRPSAHTDASLAPLLRGDLDAIVLKAMRAEPSERYPSAEALGGDVRNHLARAPVSARGDATSYLLRAMVRRHRTAFAFSAFAIALLVFGIASTAWQAHRAREEARRAEKAEEFLVSMLRAFDPDRGTPVTQREILERGEKRLDELDDQPEEQARLLQVFAETWYNLEDYDHAQPAAERALAIERRHGPRSIAVAKTLIVLGDVHFERSEYAESERLLDEALDIAREAEGPRGITVAHALNELAGVKRKLVKFADAEKLRRESLDIYRERDGERAVATLGVMNDLAVLIGDEGRYAESAELQQKTCDLMTSVRGAEHIDTLGCLANLSRDYIELGRAADAEALLARVQATQLKLYGSDWGDLLHTEHMHARALDSLGRSSDAIAMYDDSLARTKKALGENDVQVAAILADEAVAMRHAGKPADADAAARRAIAIAQARVGDDHATTARARYALACALFDEGHADDARSEMRRALATQTKLLGDAHADTVRSKAEIVREEKK